MKKKLTPSAHDNAQRYNDARPADYVRISIVVRPTKRNKSTTVLESRDKQTTAGCASLMADEIEIEAELDNRRNAARRTNPRQLPGTDKVGLSIQDYNDL